MLMKLALALAKEAADALVERAVGLVKGEGEGTKLLVHSFLLKT